MGCFAVLRVAAEGATQDSEPFWDWPVVDPSAASFVVDEASFS